jgi:hypothetical protein
MASLAIIALEGFVMRAFWFLLALVSMTSCANNLNRDEAAPPNIPALEYITITYGDELERYKRLFLHDSSATYDDNYLEIICIKLRTMDIMDVLEARDLIVYVVEGLLARINEDPEVANDLLSFPFTADRLHIEIEFDSFYNKYINPRSVASIYLCHGMVHYYARDAHDPDTAWFHLRAEPYDKAYRFSRFKTYRPWIKVPAKAAGEFRDLDVGSETVGNSSFPVPILREPPVRPWQSEEDISNDAPLGRLPVDGRFPASNTKVQAN